MNPKKRGVKQGRATVRGAKVSQSNMFETVHSAGKLQKGTIKRSVTFAADVDERAHRLVGARGFSAFVNDATRAALQFAATDRLIAELEAQYGRVTDHELNEARNTLRQARKRRA